MTMKTYLFFLILFCAQMNLWASEYTVTATRLNVRAQASPTSQKIASIDKGQMVEGELLGNGWAKIEYSLGDGFIRRGYVSSDFLELVKTPPKKKAKKHVVSKREKYQHNIYFVNAVIVILTLLLVGMLYNNKNEGTGLMAIMTLLILISSCIIIVYHLRGGEVINPDGSGFFETIFAWLFVAAIVVGIAYAMHYGYYSMCMESSHMGGFWYIFPLAIASVSNAFSWLDVAIQQGIIVISIVVQIVMQIINSSSVKYKIIGSIVIIAYNYAAYLLVISSIELVFIGAIIGGILYFLIGGVLSSGGSTSTSTSTGSSSSSGAMSLQEHYDSLSYSDKDYYVRCCDMYNNGYCNKGSGTSECGVASNGYVSTCLDQDYLKSAIRY